MAGLLALFISLQGWAGVTVDDLVIQPQQSLHVAKELSRAEVQADLELLSLALRDGYEGPDFRAGLKTISARISTPKKFCNEIASVLSSVTNTHLHAYLDFKNCGQPFEAGRVGANLAAGLDRWLVQQVDGVSVVAIPTFWPVFDAHWNGLLDKIRELRDLNKPFVIDLRGNPGGDDSVGFELARILLGADAKATLPTPILSREFRQTPAAFALLANAWMWTELRAKRDNVPVPDGVQQRRREILEWMERAKRKEFPDLYEERLIPAVLDKAKIFDQEVYILVDRGCASSCENTIQILENLPRRILVGEDTFGAIEYGNVGRILLPNSKVSITVTTMSVKFKDGRHLEKVGYRPDIAIPSGNDALKESIKRINGK